MTTERGTQGLGDAGNNWDLENAVRRPGVRQDGVAVLVRLSYTDFNKLSECAEAEGITISTLLRNAAVEMVGQS